MTQSRRETRATTKGAKPRRPQRTGWRRVAVGTLKWGSLTALFLFVVGAIAVVVAYNKISIPQPNEMANAQVSIVYYADGKTEMDRIVAPDANRESVALAKVPKAVQEAHLAAEDRSFYTNNGISPSGILRAVKSGISGDAQSGGSTITQQYVKNYFLTQDRTLTRKAKEILISVKIDGQLSKSDILENYLNTIYYGRGAYGIQSAARTYFNRDVTQLTTAQGAVLASVINAPSLYDPANGEKSLTRLTNRYHYVLDGMVQEGWLSAADRTKFDALPQIAPIKKTTSGTGPTGYITAEVRKELTALGLTEEDLLKGGLRITTTIDKKAQSSAIMAMKDNLPKGVQGGLVAIKPGDGAVVAMYGGVDYAKTQLNSATQAILQAGSNFKPFAVLAAVRDGVSTKTRFDGNSPKKFGSDVTINNFNHTSYGQVDMRRMIGRSINTAFVDLNETLGPDKTRLAAIDAGIPAKTTGLDDSLTNVLGSSSPHVVDMAAAYSTIASQGMRSKPYVISKITSTTSDYAYAVKPNVARAFDKDVTADVTDAMTYTVRTGGTATKLQRLGRDIAGKTGTSEENKSKWFSGFVPQLAVSVGMYKPSPDGKTNLTLTDSESALPDGSTIPANIWLDFMSPVLQGMPKAAFPPRVGIGDNKVTPTFTPTPTTQTSTTTEATTTTTEATTTTTTTTTQPPTTPPPVTTTVPPTTAPPTTRPRPTRTQPTRTTITIPQPGGG